MHLLVLAVGLGLLSVGCDQSARGKPGTGSPTATVATPPPKPPPAPETIGKIHWVGKDRLEENTNAPAINGIWSLTESTNLEVQTLGKLATAPWRLFAGVAALSNAPSDLLLPILEDILRRETLLEIRETRQNPGALVLATRVEAAHAALWTTNLAAVFENLTGGKTVQDGTNGWTLERQASPSYAELRVAGDWVVFGLSQSSNRFAGEMAERLLKSQTSLTDSNYFVSADLDLARISGAFQLGWEIPAGWPRLTLTLTADGGNTRTRGELVFPKPLPFQLEPWNIPTNQIHDPLVSFTALQGIGPWLEAWPAYKELKLGPAPNQVFLWAQHGVPFLSYAAATVPDGTNLISNLTQALATGVNPWMTNNGIGFFEKGTNGAEVAWSEVPLITPFLRVVPSINTNFVLGGLVPLLNTNKPMPAELLRQFESRKDLAGYDWEVTGPRIQQWLNFGQLLRFALNKAQISPSSAGFVWLRAMEERLGNSGTTLAVTAPNRLMLTRNSAIGLSSAELLWLVDWLESPSFPKGLNTFTGKPEILDPRRLKGRKQPDLPK